MRAITRIRLLTLGSVLVTALIISLTAIVGVRTMLRTAQREGLRHDVRREAERLRLALRELQSDVRLLAALPATRRTLELSRSPQADPREAADAKGQIAQVFLEMLNVKPTYAQLRLIGVAGEGREVVRVDRSGGERRQTPEEELQSNEGRDYFRDTLATPPDRLYASPITLNQERDQIQLRPQRVLSIGMRLDGPDGAPLGMVIIDQNLDRLFEDLFGQTPDAQELLVMNSAGDFLRSAQRDRTSGWDLGRRWVLQEELPAAAPIFAAGGPATLSAPIDDPRWDRMELRRVQLIEGDPERFVVIGLRQGSGMIEAGSLRVLRSIVNAALTLSLASGGAAVVVGRLQTRPLERITKAAERVARGEPMPRLPVRLANEMGELARAVRDMNHTLQGRQRELRQANHRLEAANDDLEHFVHIASHDLREPLRKQRKLIDLLEIDRLGGAASQENLDLLARVKDCSTSMQRMIDDFRTLTRIGSEEQSRVNANLPSLIAEALAAHSVEIDQRGVVVEHDEFPAASCVYPALVVVLYENLIGNALRYSSRDGFTIRFTAARQDGEWWYGVRNTHSSIPQEQLEEVFKLFRRASNSSGEGSGVGLSLCRKIVERHRGRIRAASEEDHVYIGFSLGEELSDHQD